MTRFTSYLLICFVGMLGLSGCGGGETEEMAEEEMAMDEMVEEVAMINVEVTGVGEEDGSISTSGTSYQLMEAGFASDGWVSITHNDQTMVIPMVMDASGLEEGASYAMVDGESGMLHIGNAAGIGAAVGDMLHVMAADDPNMGEGEMMEDGMEEGEMGEGEMNEEEAETQPGQ